MVSYKKAVRKFAGVMIVLLVASFSLQAGGPWLKAKGKYYIKLSEWWLIYDEHYTDTGFKDPNLTSGIFNTFLYAEIGVSDRFTSIFSGALFSRNYMNNLRSLTTNEIIVNGDAVNSIGDIDLGIKYNLSKAGAKTPMALSLIIGLPLGATSKGEFGNLQTGDGELNQMVQFDIGRSFQLKNTSLYINGYTAMNNRTNGFSEEFRYGLEIGIGLFSEKVWVNTKYNGLTSLKNGETAETISSTSIFANNSEFQSLAFEANYFITKKMGFSLSFANAFSGKIIAAAPSYSIGVFMDIK